MPRRKITFDVAVNTPSAQREADRLKQIFQSRLSSVNVGTNARGGGGGGGGGGAAGGGGSSGKGGPGSSLNNLLFGSAQFALAGYAYQFFSALPQTVMELDRLATVNKRAEASFRTLAGSTEEANAMIEAFQQGSGNTATRLESVEGAMRLYNIGMAENAEQMRQFTTLSRGMAQALGRDVTYVQEQFSLGLANQSTLRFDQLGLSLERHQQLMDEIGKEYPDLTREVVFQNAMLTQAMEKYYNLAASQEALATSTEIASRAMRDQGAVLGDLVSKSIVQPAAVPIARMFGADDYNLQAVNIQNRVDTMRRAYEKTESKRQPNMWDQFVGQFFGGKMPDEVTMDFFDNRRSQMGQFEDVARMGESLIELMNTLQAASNAGVEIDDSWVTTLEEGNAAIYTNVENYDKWIGRIESTSALVRMASDDLSGMNDELMRTSTAAEIMAGRMEELAGRLLGGVTGMVGKLMEIGVSPEGIRGMLPNQGQIEARVRDMGEQIAIAGGDAIDQEILYQQAQRDLLAEAQGTLDAYDESIRAGKEAATAMEQAAKEAEKAFVNAADEVMDAYKSMLHEIPGLFKTSEVTEEDLQLAKMGFGVNYADDALRRLEDVAFNKTKRDDVDLGRWAQALGMPGDTDPKALAIFARRRWEDLSIFASPENFDLLNIDAAKADLKQQELAALGQQNLEALFGIGTDQGKEFLRVFGVEALDPIQDGLITEISTRGPIMGETLANAMYTGFNTRALELPWVQSLVSAIDAEIARKILGDLNKDASGDQAAADSVPLEE